MFAQHKVNRMCCKQGLRFLPNKKVFLGTVFVLAWYLFYIVRHIPLYGPKQQTKKEKNNVPLTIETAKQL